MHRAKLLLVPVIAFGLSGCFLKKTPVAAAPPPPKPAAPPTPAPPPEPLSLPQTTVTLPPLQTLSQEALNTTQPPEETPVPAPPPRPNRLPRQPGTGQQRAPEPAPPPVTAPPPTEPERPPLQEMLTGPEKQRLQDEASARKTEAQRLVDQARRRHLTRQQNGVVERILSFIKQANEAEQRGDMRQANELAERALVLARDLKP
jgi:hypothetical protein